MNHYKGLGSHIYVHLRPEPIDESDEPEERVMKFSRRTTAVRWVEHVFSTDFDPEHDRLEWESEETHRWFYPEGD
jgi:hypothetical protein